MITLDLMTKNILPHVNLTFKIFDILGRNKHSNTTKTIQATTSKNISLHLATQKLALMAKYHSCLIDKLC